MNDTSLDIDGVEHASQEDIEAITSYAKKQFFQNGMTDIIPVIQDLTDQGYQPALVNKIVDEVYQSKFGKTQVPKSKGKIPLIIGLILVIIGIIAQINFGGFHFTTAITGVILIIIGVYLHSKPRYY